MSTRALNLTQALSHLPQPLRRMPAFLATILSYLTIRNLLLLYLALNAKNLPLAWELRLIYRTIAVWKNKRTVAKLLRSSASKLPQPQQQDVPASSHSLPAHAHPLFRPITIHTLTPLLEIDHNLHKSNSTYFSDLDESRTALMVHLLSSTGMDRTELERKGYKGPLKVILGSVYASFGKEVKMYEVYAVRSRVLGWGPKWIVIGSYFVREGKRGEGKEVLLATCLSKYVVKKGRFTVPPEQCFKAAGWLPDRPEGTRVLGDKNGDYSGSEVVGTPVEGGDEKGEVVLTEEDLRRRAGENVKRAAEKLSGEGARSELDEECRAAASKWSWEEIDRERERGMKVAEKWLGLDEELKEEYQHDLDLGIS